MCRKSKYSSSLGPCKSGCHRVIRVVRCGLLVCHVLEFVASYEYHLSSPQIVLHTRYDICFNGSDVCTGDHTRCLVSATTASRQLSIVYRYRQAIVAYARTYREVICDLCVVSFLPNDISTPRSVLIVHPSEVPLRISYDTSYKLWGHRLKWL